MPPLISLRRRVSRLVPGRVVGRPVSSPAGVTTNRYLDVIRPAFDAAFYRRAYPDVGRAGADPLLHYVRHGWREGRMPSATFSTEYYRATYGEVVAQDVDPLYHYLSEGRGKGYLPMAPGTDFAAEFEMVSAHLDANYYRLRYPEIDAHGFDPAYHYVMWGWRSGYDPAPDFSTRDYLARQRDVRVAGINPLYHYLTIGKAEGREVEIADIDQAITEAVVPTEFDAEVYLTDNYDLAPDGDLAVHYARFGWKEGRDPNRWFSTNFYLKQQPDLRERGWCPFAHYLLVGRKRGYPPQDPLPAEVEDAVRAAGLRDTSWACVFSSRDYVDLHGLGKEAASRSGALLHFLREGLDRVLPFSLEDPFDPAFYRDYYGELGLDSDAAALRHWLDEGYRGGRYGVPTQLLARLRIRSQRVEEPFLAALCSRYGRSDTWRLYEEFANGRVMSDPLDDLVAGGHEASLLDLVRSRIDRYQFDAAVQLAARIDAAGGRSAEGKRLMAAGYALGGVPGAAADLYAQTFGDEVNEELHFIAYAEALAALGRYDEAIEVCKRAPVAVVPPARLVDCQKNSTDEAFAEGVAGAFALARQGDRAGACEAARQACAALFRHKDVAASLDVPFAVGEIRSVAIYTDCTLPQCLFYRVDQKVAHLEAAGYRVRVFRGGGERALLGAMGEIDAVIFYRVGMNPTIADLIAKVRGAGRATFYEVDDLIFDSAHFPDSFDSYGGLISTEVYGELIVGTAMVEAAMGLCDYGIASTPALASAMEPHVRSGKVFVHRNTPLKDGDMQAPPEQKADRDRPVTLFYGSGTKAHNSDFTDNLAPALERIFETHGDKVRLVVVGYLTLPESLKRFASQITTVEPIWNYAGYWALLSSVADINLSVLAPGPVNDCKSEIKWIEAAMFSIPSIVSDTQTFREVIEDGKTGLIASGVESWVAALDRLIADRQAREDMGRAAFAAVAEDYSLDAAAANVGNILDRVEADIDTQKNPRKPSVKVLVVAVFYPPHSIGGATRVVHDNVRDIREEFGDDIEIEVFTSVPAGSDDPELLRSNELMPYEQRTYVHEGVPVTVIATPLEKDTEIRAEDAKVREAFARHVERSKPDLVHFHCIQRLTTSVIDVAAEADIPYIVTVHDGWWISPYQFIVDMWGKPCFYDFDDPVASGLLFEDDEPARNVILRRRLAGADRLLAVSESFARIYRERGFQVEAVPNGTSPIDERPRTVNADGRVRIGHLGGMGLEKGIHLVRQALLRGGFENLEFVYVDHSLPFGTEQTTSYGTTPVRVLGKFPASRVADLYAQFDVLVAPSIWPESFGLVTREALSLGLWVIASNLGAMGEDVVEGENGFVIPVDTPDGLIDAFSKVDADPGRYKQPPEIRPKIRTAKDQARDMAAIYLDYAKKG